MPENGPPEWRMEGPRPGKQVRVSVLGRNMLEFTHHALVQMKIRRIGEDEVIDTIRDPEVIDLPARQGRERVRRWRNRSTAIDVVYEMRRDSIRVITAIKVNKPNPERRRRKRR